MSDLRIALVAEGPTDATIITAALAAILPFPFVPTLLQPEATRPDLGAGWGGVLKWSREFNSRGFPSLEEDPTLGLYDMFIVHIDADVADFSYADCGPGIEEAARTEGWGALPCSADCPPPDAAVNNVKAVLETWVGRAAWGDRTILCIPSKSSEAWLAAAVYPGNTKLLAALECCTTMEARLSALPKGEKIKKKVKEYVLLAATITSNWPDVRRKCTRADAFHIEVEAASKRLGG